jgi:cytochrome b involved in lipid metabolism
MNIQSQKGFIPLIALLIALLSVGGGVAAYEIHKHNEEAKSGDVVQEGSSKGNVPSESTKEAVEAPQRSVGTQTTTTTNPQTIRREYEREESEEEEDDDEGGSRTTTTPVSTANPAAATTFYTMAQVKTHNSRTSCWTAVYGGVYDVTKWISQHPGGAGAILGMCGVDGTSAFDAQHGGQSRANAELGSFKIGVLK